jgi:hypothetical protein
MSIEISLQIVDLDFHNKEVFNMEVIFQLAPKELCRNELLVVMMSSVLKICAMIGKFLP